jgi:hypothetical protein
MHLLVAQAVLCQHLVSAVVQVVEDLAVLVVDILDRTYHLESH